jgi:SagB-type dehydrogenase family enzyme
MQNRKSARLIFIIFFIFLMGTLWGIDNGGTVKLPIPKHQGTVSVEQAIFQRRSIRNYKDEALSLEEVSQILWAAQGKTVDWGGRTVPSAGATYPLEIYIVVGDVKDLELGLYHYKQENHELLKMNDKDIRNEIASAAWRQEFIGQAPIIIVIAADYNRTTKRYGKQGIRYVDNEVGHCGQNIYLQCEALGLGTVAIGAFQEDRVIQILKIKEEPIYIMPIGKKK